MRIAMYYVELIPDENDRNNVYQKVLETLREKNSYNEIIEMVAIYEFEGLRSYINKNCHVQSLDEPLQEYGKDKKINQLKFILLTLEIMRSLMRNTAQCVNFTRVILSRFHRLVGSLFLNNIAYSKGAVKKDGYC